MPHELALVGIYFSPLLPIVLFGILGALATAFGVEPYRAFRLVRQSAVGVYGVDRHLCVSPPTVRDGSMSINSLLRWFLTLLIIVIACVFLLHPLQRLFQESVDA